jgi:hypothetical protein
MPRVLVSFVLNGIFPDRITKGGKRPIEGLREIEDCKRRKTFIFYDSLVDI